MNCLYCFSITAKRLRLILTTRIVPAILSIVVAIAFWWLLQQVKVYAPEQFVALFNQSLIDFVADIVVDDLI